jgi:hypothetical protein
MNTIDELWIVNATEPEVELGLPDVLGESRERKNQRCQDSKTQITAAVYND